MLCDLLESTGIAGSPASYFRRESIPRWHQRLGVPIAEGSDGREFDQCYVDAVIRQGTGHTGVFGLRLMWDSAGELSQRLDGLLPGLKDDHARLEAIFGPTLFIHLSRIDKVSQAVSHLRAMQTGLWHLAADGTERERTGAAREAVYDRDAIGDYVKQLTLDDQAWNQWFADNRIAPVRLTYEALSLDPQQGLAAILSGLGLDSTIAAAIEPRTRKIGDLGSQDWAARFRTEPDAPAR
jgi:LPS sulfotransferase NodH